MTILYRVHHNLYVNMTNKCPCACTFCLRQTRDEMEGSGSLWLKREPSVVFCGFGEPTERFDDLIQVAAFVKQTYGKPIRINTNGLGNLINNRNIAPDMKNIIDTISISLNTPNAEKYLELTRSKFGQISFQAMLNFAGEAKKYVPNVVLSTVATTLTKEEEAQCSSICRNLGVTYRIRPWED